MIYNISLFNNLLDIISKKLLQEYSIEELANTLILAPHKMAVKNLQTLLLQNSQGKALLLPKIITLHDFKYTPYNNHILLPQETQDILKQTISPTARSFLLSQIVQKKDHTISLNHSIKLSTSMGDLIDRAYWENINFNNIESLVDANLASHWQDILKFLDIAIKFWPDFLKERNLVDNAYMQKLIIKNQNTLWQFQPPQYHKIITLNVVSFYDDIINLVKTISALPQGDVYFYGIDFTLDDNIFKNKLDSTHPQQIFSYMLNKLSIERKNIKNYTEDKDTVSDNIIHRLFDKQINTSLSQHTVDSFAKPITIINNKNDDEEGLTIALALREVLETENKTAGLITNNSILVTRVLNYLNLWGIEVDDYIGIPLIDTPHARLFVLVGQLMIDGFDPHTLLSLLNHPLTFCNQERNYIIKQAKNLDLHVFRQFIEKYTLSSYKKYTKKSQVTEQTKKDIHNFIEHIESNLSELVTFLAKAKKNKTYNFQDLLILHIKTAEIISSSPTSKDKEIWSNQEGKELSLFLSSLLEDSKYINQVSIRDYLDIIKTTMQEVKVRAIYNKHPRLHIYGSLQNNLIKHDLIILGNLNEKSMPTTPIASPWMNKYIASQLGFIDNATSIGLQAHYFTQNLGAKELILSRSEKNAGELTTQSRWLAKLETLLSYYYKQKDITHIKAINTKGYLYDIQNKLFNPTAFHPLTLSDLSISPHLSRRPVTISATQYEDLVKNPYVFFVKRILKLKPLDIVKPQMNKSHYGTMFHEVLELFFKDIQKVKALNVEEQTTLLINMAQKAFLPILSNPIEYMFKWPIIKNSIQLLLQKQQDIIPKIQTTSVEVSGVMDIMVKNIIITLKGKADRIDIMDNGNINIFDYKTSSNTKVEDYQTQLLMLSLLVINHKMQDIILPNLINNIVAEYIFLPNKLNDGIKNKDNGIDNILEYLHTFRIDIDKVIEQYYIDESSYIFNKDDPKSDENYTYFARLDEWGINLSNIISPDNNGEE